MKNLSEFACFAPEGDGGVAAAPASPAAAPSAPAAPAAPAASPSATPSAAPDAAPSAAAPAGTPAAPTAPSWLDGLRGAGLPVGKDEAETVANLRRSHEQLQAFEKIRHLVPHVQTYLQQAKEFNDWRAQQAKPPAPIAAKTGAAGDPYWKESWQPPEYNEGWLSQVTKDANGNLIPIAGASPEVVSKLQKADEFRREQINKFLANPFEFMAPMQKHLEARAQEIAEKTLQQHMGQTQAQQSARQFVEQNASWLFEMDPATKAPKTAQVIDPTTGQWRSTEVLSPWGERMTKYATQLRENGLPQEQIQALAYAQVQRDYAVWENQEIRAGRIAITPAAAGVPPVDPQAAANQAFLDANNPAKPQKGKGPPAAETEVTGKNFREQLLKAFNENGITKQTLAG